MAAATTDRDTMRVEGRKRVLPMAAAAVAIKGTIAAIIASGTGAGNVKEGATAATLLGVGVFTETVTNAGLDGAISVEIESGVHGPFVNSATADEITRAAIGAVCYIVDNQTVALTSGSATRSIAGKVWDVTADGVWIQF